MGSWRLQGRERVVVPVMGLVMVLGVVGALRVGLFSGGSDAGGADAVGAGVASEDPGSTATADDGRDDGLTLADASYAPGDCVMWDAEGSGRVDTDLVLCTEEHQIEITEEVRVEDQGGYPSDDEWGLLNQARCGPAAERFLEVPLDPYGRFYADSIIPFEDSWAGGDHTMWCGISSSGPRDGRDDQPFAEDVRGADQAYHYPVGSCVALPADASPHLVPCTDGHHMEIVGELDLSGRQEPPVGAQERGLFDDCAAQARTYLGAEPVAPWQIGKETMTEESWAAGSRVVHCFLGQWDADGQQIEITGSAKG